MSCGYVVSVQLQFQLPGNFVSFSRCVAFVSEYNGSNDEEECISRWYELHKNHIFAKFARKGTEAILLHQDIGAQLLDAARELGEEITLQIRKKTVGFCAPMLGYSAEEGTEDTKKDVVARTVIASVGQNSCELFLLASEAHSAVQNIRINDAYAEAGETICSLVQREWESDGAEHTIAGCVEYLVKAKTVAFHVDKVMASMVRVVGMSNGEDV